MESDERKPLKAEFSMEYAAIDDENSNVCTSWKQFKYNFDIVDYEVIFINNNNINQISILIIHSQNLCSKIKCYVVFVVAQMIKLNKQIRPTYN